jgi:hypothetical protein
MTMVRYLVLLTIAASALAPSTLASPAGSQRTFASPEEAVRALAAAVKTEKLDDLIAIFGPEGQDLADSSDPATGRRNRQVFAVAFAEGWRLADQDATHKVLVIGNEDWPFPVPLVRDGNTWRFDTAAGKEEVLARRIGRNELAVIQTCHAYANAQQRYAQEAHDGKPAGLYAAKFRSDPGRQDGLYWPGARGQKLSPLGDLVAGAAAEGRPLADSRESPTPFHGYYFRILTAQGANAPGGRKAYIVNGEMSGGFALVAWPAHYDESGVMTFVVSQDGVVHQKDLGPETDRIARTMTEFNPDGSWSEVR